MPIQIALANPAPDAALELREVQPTRGGDFAAFVVVRSGGFAAAVPFFFTRRALLDFVAPLSALVTGGTGAATLTSTTAGSFITLEPTTNGVTVKGTLREADPGQSLEFGFPTARANTEPFLVGVRTLIETAASSA